MRSRAPRLHRPPNFRSSEVATIKPVEPNVGHHVGAKVYPGGRVVINTFSLKALICTAFGVGYWQLSGGPDWAGKDEFDIEGKTPDTSPPTDFSLRFTNFTIDDERLRQMLQALLIERFQLKFHRETTTGQIYLLEKSGKPIPFKAAKKPEEAYGEGYSEVGGGTRRWCLLNASTSQLAEYTGRILNHPVIDKTGLDGAYDYCLDMLSASPDAEPPDYHDSFKLFIQAAGLRLTPSTGQVETFVIDHAEQPTPN